MGEGRDRRRLAATAVAVGALVMLVGAISQFVPWLTRHGDAISGTPVHADLVAPTRVALDPGARACLAPVSLDPTSQVARLLVRRVPAAGVPLRVELTAAGARTAATARALRESRQVDVPIAAPRAATTGRICVRNLGTVVLQLVGTADPRALTRTRMTLDGRPQADAFSLTLLERGSRSKLERASELVDHAAALSPLGSWFFWLLVPLLLIAVPALVLAALYLALRSPPT
jgi:hypothetical protein